MTGLFLPGGLFGKKKPVVCYRCALPLRGNDIHEYMGLKYCEICRDVVLAMINVVHHDPPFGFPGNRGYLEPLPPDPYKLKEG